MIPLRALPVCFRNRHQYNVTFRHRYSITFGGGGWKGNQILKYRFSFTVMWKMLLEFSSFISLRYLVFKGYLHYKTITSRNVSSEAQVKSFLIS